MTDHKILADSELHEPKGMQPLVGGAADIGKVLVSKGDGTSEARKLSLTDLEETLNIVYVSTENDFPAPAGGFITLADRTAYIITQDLSVSFPLKHNGVVQMEALNSGLATISYAGVLPFLNNANDDGNDDLRIDNLTIACPLAPLFGFTAPTTGSGNIRVESCDVVAATLGTLQNVNQMQFNQMEMALSTSGSVLSGVVTNPIVNLTNLLVLMSAGTFLDVTGVVIAGGRLEFTQILQTGATPVTGINSVGGANVAEGSLMTVSTCLFNCDTPLAGGVTTISARWQFLNALPLQDSQTAAATYLDTPETVTINTIGVFEQILGGNWQEVVFTEAVDVDADGIITYVGERSVAVFVVATATVEKVGGGADEVDVRLAQNGVTIPYTEGRTQNPTPTQVTCTAVLQLQPDDTLELQVANGTSTADVVVNLASITGTRVP